VAPQNNSKRDIERKLKVNPDLFLVGELEGKVIATCMAGYEGHRGWINYLAVSPKRRRQGYAARMMQEAEKILREAGCPKINLQIRTSNTDVIEFYKAVGFKMDDVVSMGKRLEQDDALSI
jgi:ribosomal protein S18 acetylase RimI-like enzyme